MTLLTRLNTPHEANATGIIAPLVRVASHLGYCAGLAAREYENDADWSDAYHDLKDDLEEAILHLDNPPDMSPFIPQEAIDLLAEVRIGITALFQGEQTKEEVFADLQTLTHNAAYAAAQYEHFTAGLDTSEGTQA
jgi:hypothetical protein